MATLEIFLSSTKELMSGTTKYKNGEVTKSAFNNAMMLNLAFLLDTLNKQLIEFPSDQEEEQSNIEGDKEKELISNPPNEETNIEDKHIPKNKQEKLIDVYLPLSQLSYSIETTMQNVNTVNTFKGLKNVMKSISTNFKGTSMSHTNQNNVNNNMNNNEDSPFNDIEFEQMPFKTQKHIQEEEKINEEEEIDIENDDKANISQNNEFDILFTGEVNDYLFDNYDNITNKETLTIQNNTVFNTCDDVDEMENELFNYLPDKKIESCNPSTINTADLEASNGMRYRKEVISFIMNRETTNPFFSSSRNTKSKIKKKNSFSHVFIEFEPFLNKKVVKTYLSDMNDNYLRYMLFHYQKVKKNSENILVCEEKMFLNMIKVFILEMGISDRKIYEDTLRNLVYKKKNYDFENFLSCFAKILKLKDENSVIKYKFLLYVTIMGEEKRLNKNHLKKYFELIRCSKVYDEELCEDITENLILKYTSVYPGEKYISFPLERIMLLLETFFDNR